MAIIPLEIMPVGATGEKAAPFAAPTTTNVMRNAGILTRAAIAIAIGAIKAHPAMLPGPIVVIKVVNMKIINGIRAVLPLHKRTE